MDTRESAKPLIHKGIARSSTTLAHGRTPACPHLRQDVVRVRAHRADDPLRRIRLRMVGRPQHRLHQHGCRIDAPLGQAVHEAASVAGVARLVHDTVTFHLRQPVAEDARRDPLPCLQEIVEAPGALLVALWMALACREPHPGNHARV